MSFVGCRVFSTVSVTNGGYPGSVVPSWTESWDTDAFHDAVTNPSRITIPTGLGGKYLLGASIAWGNDSSATAARAVYYRKNGSIVGGSRQGEGGGYLVHTFGDEIELAAGDYLELNPYQETGSTLTGVVCIFWIELVDRSGEDKKISELAALTSLDGAEEFVVNDGGTSKKITAANLGRHALIEEIEVGVGGLATIDFDSIPATFRHLEIRYSAQTEGALAAIKFAFNTDTTDGNYQTSRILNAGTSVGGFTFANRYCGAATGTAEALPAFGEVSFPFYANTLNEHGSLSRGFYRTGGVNYNDAWFCQWNSSAVIDRIRLTVDGGGEFKEGSIFSLHGIA